MIDLKELYWAAGFIEGEGSFSTRRGPVRKDGTRSSVYTVQVAQVQRQPLERLQKLFGGSIYKKCVTQAGNQMFIWIVSGRRAAAISMTLWFLMSPRRQEQIEQGLATWKNAPAYDWKRISKPLAVFGVTQHAS